jgi:hypothetical protein
MKHLIFEYGWIVCSGAGIFGYLLYLSKKRGREKALTEAKTIAYKLMLASEKRFSKGENKEKFEWVVEKYYKYLPNSIKFLFDKEDIEKFLEKCYVEFKELLNH